jgi:hypothetical protein
MVHGSLKEFLDLCYALIGFRRDERSLLPNVFINYAEAEMRSIDEQVLKVTKEIVAKFIEVGRVSPGSFDEVFKSIYASVREAIVSHAIEEEE